MENTTTKKNGAKVGIIIIVLILIAGAIYYWQATKKEVVPVEQPVAEGTEDISNVEGTAIENDATIEDDDSDLFETSDMDASEIPL